MNTLKITDLSELINGELVGNKELIISGPEQLERAKIGHISFIGSRKYIKAWQISKAMAAIIKNTIKLEPEQGKALIRVKNADLAMIKILEFFNTGAPKLETGVHPMATVHKTAVIGQNCVISAGCYVGKNVILEDNVFLYPNVSVLDETRIGNNTVVWSGTVIRERSEIGSYCIFHSNVSIGSDGFGYRPSDDGRGLVKIPQIGNVVIGHQVEIGANSCVDRGKFSSTIIGDGCKIDNLVQIGHNSVLGRSCIMAGGSGLAGSVTLEDGVIIGGSASIKDHTTIHSGAIVGGGSGVMNDVAAGKTVLGYPACDSKDMLKQWIALRNLIKN